MRKSILILGLVHLAGNALAANIHIGPNGCDLASAIRSANNDSSVGNCASGSGTDYIIAPDGWVAPLNGTLPTITSDLTIRSASAAGVFHIEGDGEHRVMKITGNDTEVTLQRVQISGGYTDPYDLPYGVSPSDGPAIWIVDATVHLQDSIIIGNGAAFGNTGSVFVTDGQLTIAGSTIENNQTMGVVAEDSSVQIVDSTFSDNRGFELSLRGVHLSIEGSLLEARSQAIDFREGFTANITNTTIQYAIPPIQGYGRALVDFRVGSVVTLSHVTIDSDLYGDSSFSGAFLSVSNSFLGLCELNNSSQLVLNVNNLHYRPSGTLATNCLGLTAGNHGLLPLADNGGPTRTRAIGNPDSAAINAGDPAYCEPLDQRGESRDVTCDIGAYEVSEVADVSVEASIDPGASYASNQHVTYLAEIVNSGPGPATHVEIDLDVDGALVTAIDSAFCNAFPCVVTSLQAGQTLVIPVDMTLFGHFSGPFSVDLSAHSTANSTYDDADEDDPSGNNRHSVSYPINAAADLAITLDLITDGPFFNGQTLAYTALIENLGPQTASGVQLEFAPENLSGISFSGCTSASGALCNVANIASGGSRSIGIQAVVADQQFNAVGTVRATQLDVVPGNNIDNSNNGGGVSKADITVQLSLQQAGPYHSYQYLSFDIALAAGDEAASNIRLFYDFPGAELIDIQGCAGFPCIIPSLAANSEIHLTAQFFAPFADPGMIDAFRFHVLATPGQEDSEPSDNEDEIIQPLAPMADLGAQLNLLSDPPFYAGQDVVYALRVPNAGLNAANAVAITHFPQNMTLQSAFGGLCQTLDCNIARMNAFDEENITLIYRIDQPGDFDLTVTAAADEFDGSPANNTDSTGNGGTALPAPRPSEMFLDGFE